MSRTVFINGRYCPEEEAQVSIFDRGLLFADAIYEVAAVMDGKLLDFASHLARLDRSLVEMDMPAPMTHDEILAMMRKLVSANGIEEGLVYLQVTRGSSGDRDFVPEKGMTPTVFAFTQTQSAAAAEKREHGITMYSYPDLRWARRDIKTVGLMGSVFAKSAVKPKGAGEALLHENGVVTEGGATSFYIVKDGKLITRPLSNAILPGCTRKALLSLLASDAVVLDERLFTLEETLAADEAFITGASTYVTPVVAIDDVTLGNGEPGPITRRMQQLYMEHAKEDAI